MGLGGSGLSLFQATTLQSGHEEAAQDIPGLGLGLR